MVGALAIAALGAVSAVGPLYLLGLALASFAPPRAGKQKRRWPSVSVVVPAHNEVGSIGRCVRALLDQTYPPTRLRVIVVADNCTDATASEAADAGAELMVRADTQRRGKGHAIRWALDRLLVSADPPEAVIVVDADSVADRDLVLELSRCYVEGHDSVQADDLLQPETTSLRAELERIALLLRNRIRFAGRAALGMPASLCGNGMLLSADLLRSHPWSAFSGVEDGEYSMILRRSGIATVFAPRAKVYASTTSSRSGAYTQGVRWDGGRFHMMKTWIPMLLAQAVRQHDFRLLSTLVDLAVPPLSTLMAVAVVGTAGSIALWKLALIPAWSVAPWLVALAAIPLYVLVSFLSARLPLRSYLALAAVPAFLLLKLRVYTRLMRGFETAWVRTERPADRLAP